MHIRAIYLSITAILICLTACQWDRESFSIALKKIIAKHIQIATINEGGLGTPAIELFKELALFAQGEKIPPEKRGWVSRKIKNNLSMDVILHETETNKIKINF